LEIETQTSLIRHTVVKRRIAITEHTEQKVVALIKDNERGTFMEIVAQSDIGHHVIQETIAVFEYCLSLFPLGSPLAY
jgi:hypothetical protein